MSSAINPQPLTGSGLGQGLGNGGWKTIPHAALDVHVANRAVGFMSGSCIQTMIASVTITPGLLFPVPVNLHYLNRVSRAITAGCLSTCKPSHRILRAVCGV